jgi:hypothetical protein
MLCRSCAAFMRREEASFEAAALLEAEETARILARPVLQVAA